MSKHTPEITPEDRIAELEYTIDTIKADRDNYMNLRIEAANRIKELELATAEAQQTIHNQLEMIRTRDAELLKSQSNERGMADLSWKMTKEQYAESEAAKQRIKELEAEVLKLQNKLKEYEHNPE